MGERLCKMGFLSENDTEKIQKLNGSVWTVIINK